MIESAGFLIQGKDDGMEKMCETVGGHLHGRHCTGGNTGTGKKRLSVKKGLLLVAVCLAALALGGCGRLGGGRRIVRVALGQSETHPQYLGLLAFKETVEEELGDRYEVQIFPNEILGATQRAVELTQTGAIDFVVASNSIMETFNSNYQIFNLPYLFSSAEAYHSAMDDPNVTDGIFLTTENAGFIAVTWLDAGTRNFYTIDKPINSPADLKGLKIRVQQSPTNVTMMELLGGTATPMGFGDVYTALQSKIIDGAENNELALTDNGHGDVCKFYSYDMHQMVPDIVLANYAFLEGLSPEDRAVFDEGFRLINTVQREQWEIAVETAKDKAQNQQNVSFLYPDTAPFQEAVMPLHQSVLADNPGLQTIYDRIQDYNAQYPSGQ